MDTIKREDLIRAVKILGYQPEDVSYMVVTPSQVITNLFERDEHGNKIHTPDGYTKRVERCNVG